MVTLSIEGVGGSELTYQLAKPVITIGATSQNDVVIRAPGVAPRHLVIQRNEGLHTFIGQNRQVVVLNGERRSRGVLRVGDRIRIGMATLVVKEVGEDDEVKAPVERQTAASPSAPGPQPTQRPRSEVVLYSEPTRLAEARRHMVEVFRASVRSDLVPSLRTLFEEFFHDRQALLAWMDHEGRFQPIVSQWTTDLPKLPARTFDELAKAGRFGLLAFANRQILIFPVERGQLQSAAHLLVETDDDTREDDELVLAELARMLAVHWERVDSSSGFLGPWEANARKLVDEQLPGTSQPTRVLRDRLVEAAHSSNPVLACGRTGSGRMFVAALIASLNPSGALPVQVFQAREEDESAQRMELFGSSPDGGASSLVARARGGALVIRDIQLLSSALQREAAAAIGHDVESGYGPSVRWIATTGQDCMGLVSEGVFDATLFNLFHHHIVRVPAVEERREDLPLLMVRLLESVAAEQRKEVRGIELETLNSLLKHAFDGQMTELFAELRRLASATPDGEMVRGIVPVSSASGARQGGSEAEVANAGLLSQDDLKAVVPAVERLIIDRVLRRTTGNQSKAARVLNLSRGALIAKMKEFNIPDYRYLRRSR